MSNFKKRTTVARALQQVADKIAHGDVGVFFFGFTDAQGNYKTGVYVNDNAPVELIREMLRSAIVNLSAADDEFTEAQESNVAGNNMLQ
jgi:hypothetical protein